MAVAALDLFVFFLGGASKLRYATATVPNAALMMGPLLIAIGFAGQFWTRNRPGFRRLNLLAYAATLAFCLSYGFVMFIFTYQLLGHS
jgi:hypothetical protein